MISCILGRRGSGKSHLLKRKIRAIKKSKIAVDFLNEYQLDMEVSRPSQLIDIIENKPIYSVCYKITDDEDFRVVCAIVWSVGNCALIVDEVDNWTSAYFIPDEFKRVVRYGRHKNIDVYFCARRSSNIPRDLTSQCDEIITFAQHEPNDIKYLNDIYKGAGDLARRLGKYHYILIDLNDDAIFWYNDKSRLVEAYSSVYDTARLGLTKE